MRSQWRKTLWDAFEHSLAAALTAVTAYAISRFLFGQPQPIFSAVTAIICLAAGVENNLRQGCLVIIGVSIGIIVGELVFLIPLGLVEFRIAIAVFIAMMIGSLPRLGPPMPIQAGASSLLVIIMGPSQAGLGRFLDVLVGVVLGVVIGYLLFQRRKKKDENTVTDVK